jgi:hypothetical protein
VRKVLVNKIIKKLKLAHVGIKNYECKSFECSLDKFSYEILKDIVLVRLEELIKNPNLKR